MDLPRGATLPVPPVTAQFAALEPIWAGISSSAQLRALLVLGALFNRRVYVSDTQLIDNPRVIGDFAKRHDPDDHNLFTLLTDLVGAGVVAVGLRESNYLYREDRQDPCGSLADVLRSWQTNSPDGTGWVTSPLSETRRRMLEHLDAALSRTTGSQIPYDYLQVKQEFMRQVREEANRAGSALRTLLAGQPADLRRKYDDILSGSWFSHTPVFALLHGAGLPMHHELIQIHGLFDEIAYARAHNARLLGSDWQSDDTQPDGTALAENVLVPRRGPRERRVAVPSEDELVSSAYRMVEGPPPDLLAGLRVEEIMALREHAGELFEIQSHIEVDSLANVDETLAYALADAAADYWQTVCSHVRSTRPHLALRPTRVGIFLRQHLPSVSRLAERFATSGLATIAEVLLHAVPGTGALGDIKQSLLRHVNVEFVFFVESPRMRELRQVYPHRGWIASDARTLR